MCPNRGPDHDEMNVDELFSLQNPTPAHTPWGGDNLGIILGKPLGPPRETCDKPVKSTGLACRLDKTHRGHCRSVW